MPRPPSTPKRPSSPAAPRTGTGGKSSARSAPKPGSGSPARAAPTARPGSGPGAVRSRKAKPQAATGRSAPAVLAYLEGLEHPYKNVLLAVREQILALDPQLREELKWNAPSFRTSEHFATFSLQGKDGLRLILHRGAKARPVVGLKDQLEDPRSLIRWLGPDRGMLTFPPEAMPDGPAVEALLRQWIRLL